jgi:hypothetical protein
MAIDEQGQPLDAEEAMVRFLEAEEAEENEELPPDDEEPVETEESEDSQEETEETEEETEEIVWNGETKAVTKTELKQLAQQGFDYTQKTQQLAEERRIIALERQTLQAQSQIQEKALDIVGEVKAIDRQLANYKNVDWSALAETDPVEYLKHNHAYRELKETREAKVHEFQQVQSYGQQAQAQYAQQLLASESQKLQAKIPEFKNPEKATEIKGKMLGYLEQRGFNQAEIDTIVDSRFVEVIYDALRYKGLADTKPAVKKRIEAAPKSLKPGSAQNVSTATSEVKKRLKQTGKEEYAVRLIENML